MDSSVSDECQDAFAGDVVPQPDLTGLPDSGGRVWGCCYNQGQKKRRGPGVRELLQPWATKNAEDGKLFASVSALDYG